MISYNDFIDYLRDEQMLSDKEAALFMYCVEDDYGDYLSGLEANGYEEADRETYADAMQSLYDEYTIRNIIGGLYECGSKEYYVFDDYDDAYNEAVRDCEDLIDDMGPDGVNGFEAYVDTEWFEDAMKESYEYYCQDIESESSSGFQNRLVEECYDAGLIDDDDFETDEDGNIDYDECTVDSYDLIDRLADYLTDRQGDAVEWYIDNFGESEFREAVAANGLVDTHKLAEYCVDADGVGHSLARYDGREIEYEFEGITYYMYRS